MSPAELTHVANQVVTMLLQHERTNDAVHCPDCKGLGSGDPLCLCKVEVPIYQHSEEGTYPSDQVFGFKQ